MSEINFSLFICFELKFVQIGVCLPFQFLVIKLNAVWHGKWFCLRECEQIHFESAFKSAGDNNFVINLFEIYFLELKSFYVYIHR